MHHFSDDDFVVATRDLAPVSQQQPMTDETFQDCISRVGKLIPACHASLALFRVRIDAREPWDEALAQQTLALTLICWNGGLPPGLGKCRFDCRLNGTAHAPERLIVV